MTTSTTLEINMAWLRSVEDSLDIMIEYATEHYINTVGALDHPRNARMIAEIKQDIEDARNKSVQLTMICEVHNDQSINT
jgi:hypothetical protein